MYPQCKVEGWARLHIPNMLCGSSGVPWFHGFSYLIQNDFICCTKSLLVNILECRTSKVYIYTYLVCKSRPDSDLNRLAHPSGRFIYQMIMTILPTKHMLQEWTHKTSGPSTWYRPVLLRPVVALYPLILTLSLGNCYEVTHNLRRNEVFKDLPLEFSQKIEHALKMRFWLLAHQATSQECLLMHSPQSEILWLLLAQPKAQYSVRT